MRPDRLSFLLGIRTGKAIRRPAAGRRVSSAELARCFARRSGALPTPAHPPIPAAVPPSPPHVAAVDGAQVAPTTSIPAAAEGSCGKELAVDVKVESTEEWSDSEAEPDTSDEDGEEQDLTSNCSCYSCENLRIAEREQGEVEANLPATPDLQEAPAGSPAWVPDAPHWIDDVIILSSDDDDATD